MEESKSHLYAGFRGCLFVPQQLRADDGETRGFVLKPHPCARGVRGTGPFGTAGSDRRGWGVGCGGSYRTGLILRSGRAAPHVRSAFPRQRPSQRGSRVPGWASGARGGGRRAAPGSARSGEPGLRPRGSGAGPAGGARPAPAAGLGWARPRSAGLGSARPRPARAGCHCGGVAAAPPSRADAGDQVCGGGRRVSARRAAGPRLGPTQLRTKRARPRARRRRGKEGRREGGPGAAPPRGPGEPASPAGGAAPGGEARPGPARRAAGPGPGGGAAPAWPRWPGRPGPLTLWGRRGAGERRARRRPRAEEPGRPAPRPPAHRPARGSGIGAGRRAEAEAERAPPPPPPSPGGRWGALLQRRPSQSRPARPAPSSGLKLGSSSLGPSGFHISWCTARETNPSWALNLFPRYFVRCLYVALFLVTQA